jgi:hypothetical protein
MSLTVVVGKRHVLAGLSLLVLSVLVGVMLITPMVSQGATVYTRSVSCAGLDFYPTDSDTGYSNNGSLRTRSGAGSGTFRCDPHLPNGAKVIKVQFTAELTQFNLNYFAGIGDCALRRSGLTVSTAATADDLARVTFEPRTTTIVRLTDTSITNAKIDNASYGYWLECQFDASGFDTVGIFGADVIYRIKASQG